MPTSKIEETKPTKKTDIEVTRPSRKNDADSKAKALKAAVEKKEIEELGDNEHPITQQQLSDLLTEGQPSGKKQKRGKVLVDAGDAIFWVDLDKHSPAKVRKAIERGKLHTLAVRPKRAGWIWLGILGAVVITVVGCLIGYSLAMKARQEADLNQRLVEATKYYMLSEQDLAANNYEAAKVKLEYVLELYPNYPGATDKLTHVMVSLAQSNPNTAMEPTATTPAATVDTGNLEKLFQQAQEQLTNSDWENLLASVNGLRNTDPTFRSIKVDDLYYLALRNVAISRINNGNLEVGIYYLTMASKIGPIDQEALGYKNRAVMFLQAASGFGVTWQRAMDGFATLYDMVPYMVDVNGITVKQLYAESIAGYGDTLQSQYQWCDAKNAYEQSLSIMTLPSVSAIIEDARNKCANPPPTPTPTLEPWVTPTPTK